MENLKNDTVEKPPQIVLPEDIKVVKANKDRANTSSIQTSYDLRVLVQNLNEIGDIIGSSGNVYKKDYLISLITHLKGSDDEEGLQMITNTYGLRDKVKKLFIKKEAGKK